MPSLTSIESASSSRLPKSGMHVAIISDGNGRWASAKGLPRSAGHRAGAETARAVIAAASAGGGRLHLRLAIDYSAREAIYLAACRFYKVTELSCEAFGRVMAEFSRGGSKDVDLLIRTGGEQRLSDFLLWECAFAEFVFMEKRWPDFTAGDLRMAVEEFGRRERTRGSLPEAIAGYMLG